MLRCHVGVQISTLLKRLTTDTAVMMSPSKHVHLLVANQTLLLGELSVAQFALIGNVAAQTFHFSALQYFARSRLQRHCGKLCILFSSSHLNTIVNLIVSRQATQIVLGFNGRSRLARIQLNIARRDDVPAPLVIALLACRLRSTEAC